MRGKPAARIDDSVVEGKIVTGSRTVLIGSQGGRACSECPGGITVGSPVNPQLGAKVLLGAEDLDFALPAAALPVVWQRQYSSYVHASHGATCGLLGHGWHLLQELRIELRSEASLLFDAGGRVITFDEPLAPGGLLHSASEDLVLVRGGGAQADAAAPWSSQPRWSRVPAALASSADIVLAASGGGSNDGDTVWSFERLAGEQDGEQGPHWRLVAQFDRFGRHQRYHYSEAGRLLALTDGVGRRYRLQHQRIHAGRPAQGLWGADDGWRLGGVDLLEDPLAPLSAPIALVRYGYSAEGDLVSVHDRAGQLVRQFEWDRHRLRAHRNAAGPWHRYSYEGPQPGARVLVHSNQEGLEYRFEYLAIPAGPDGQPRAATRVRDSLGRTETYHFEGPPGLSRLTAHDKADGSCWRQRHDSFGRLVSRTDPLGRSTYLRRDGQGRLLGVQRPDGRHSSQDFDPGTGRLLQSTDATGACTRYQYDHWGRLSQRTQADGGSERYHYPEPSPAALRCKLPVRIEDARGASKHLAWSDAGQLLSYTDCSGHTTHYHYDRFGALIEVRNALGERLRHQRNEQGRIVATELPNGQVEHYHYDGAGRLTRIEPAPPEQAAQADTSIHLRYDLWGRLVKQTHAGLSLGFEYDVAGRLTRLVNENGAQSRFAWDALDRLVQEEGFDRRLQSYRWDAAGQLAETRDGNALEQRSTHYRWDEGGRLVERRLPATDHAPAQSQGYAWDAADRLVAASVWLHPDAPAGNADAKSAQLQSHIELQRDPMGRITGEVQQLYSTGPSGPQLEHTHRIAHRLDALGNRQQSELQGLGTIDWLLYGAGHVHGLQYDGQSLINIERDALHREVGRSLHRTPMPGQTAQAQDPVQIQRQWDRMGRLAAVSTRGMALPEDGARSLVGQIAARRYHYDALGQLAAIEQAAAPGQPAQLLQYGYDAAGRLRAASDSLEPQSTTRWDIDPAGNRLPEASKGPQGQAEDSWAAQVRAAWLQDSFNLLGQGQAAPQHSGPVTRWMDNRIGYDQHSAWRYDNCGNRVEQLQVQGQRQLLGYDGNHQLVEVVTQGPVGNGEQVTVASTSRYTYDALGRRLKTHTETAAGPSREATASYYGWDGDRLVHTERIDSRQPERRHISHTVYEPVSFTPLIRLSTSGQGPQAKPHALQLVMQGEDSHESHDVESLLKGMPHEMQNLLDAGLRHAMSLQLAKQEDAQAAVGIHHYHCNQLGTPLALTDREGCIAWAARLDPWGDLKEEYNPDGIDQLIRLPGQHHDREAGLHYNRHRHYDPRVGLYINQDPLGLDGGLNFYSYPVNPNSGIDPLGLQETIWAPGPNRSTLDGPRHGNWCGGKWSGGVSGGEVGNAPPVNSMDAICKAHDLCYGSNPTGDQKLTCDRTMSKDLLDLPHDPKKWPQPPIKGTEGAATRYRNLATQLFE
ncbi:RHS repeat-associated core domain-containing protein [Pseudorhodoferax sp.]|uniref:RHS repeat-associated core domain-containing protein n=1 Tax=Pseudorhodoferax sp. TaxID=1993553 RepID=UPI002DD6615B|nr:RHS repeat-associated core domain-containing protein [Pseudorhodoferax sp.]